MRTFGLLAALLAAGLNATADRVPFWFAEFPDAKVRVNYDEASVPPYTLEDPLVFADGRKVETEADWQERRAEILGIFAREMYGRRPPLPEALVTDLVDERVTCEGLVVQRQYEMTFRADRSGPKIRWIAFLPKEAKEKVPVILFLNYHGNQSLVDDSSVPMMTAWHRNGQWATNNLVVPATRGLLQRPSDSTTTFPLDEFVRRGYAVMSACYCEVSPDPNRIGKEDPKPMQDKLAYTGVFDLWPKRDPDGKSETTSLGAWSWALSRGLDLAERIPEIDAKRSVVTGCSRLGKAALLAAAYDERFAVCVPVQTGNGGAPLAKRDFGENPGTETRQFTHWFCRAYDKYRTEPWKTLTFDQHLLLASIAPRSLLVLGFNSPWFDTRGEFLSCRAASAVWEKFAGSGLPRTDFPKTGETTAVGDRLGYARRDGPHAINDWDWRNILDFADTSFGRLSTFPCTKIERRDFQSEIDAAAARGGGRVTVPAGHWLTGGLVLRSNVEIRRLVIDSRESVVLDDVNMQANLGVRAVQLDLARQMETVPFVKAFTRKVADAGYNTLVLYLEGRVRTPSFSLGEDESYSLDEMREIVAYASGCGVEVVPVVSVLGHAEHFFRNPGLEAFAEERGGLCRWSVTKKQTFCLNQPEARRFLEKYVSEVTAVFPGKFLHLGLDESFQFGFCDTCRARREEIGFGPLFTEYVKWADGLCHKLGKRMWMWDDMYEFFPEELENVPRDIVMCHWIYDNDITEWGHRGHFLNRIRIDWLAEYEKRGIDAIPVGAACVDNLKTLSDYAKRHRTFGTYVSQWELSDSFYGAPISILIGIDRAFPSLNPVERRAVEALASTWAYSRSNGGVSLSRSRRNGRISADVTLNESEPAAVRLALAVLKGAKSHPGAGEVPADPLSEEALLDDLVTHFEQILFKYELDDVSVALATPRRKASESRTAKERVRALIPEMRRVLARKELQERLWRPNMRPNDLTAPMKDNLGYAEKLLSVPDVADDEDWILGLSLSLPDFHGIPQWKISGLFPGGWREIAKGCWKPARGNWANFERKLAFKSAEAPRALRVEHSGYGDGMLLFASVWNRNRRFVPEKVIGTSGEVVDPSNVLKDDWRPVRFGFQDRAHVFVNPALSEVLSTLEFSLKEVR